MCLPCAQGGGKPIARGEFTVAAAEGSTAKKVISEEEESVSKKKVNLEEVDPDPTTSLPTEHKELLAVAKKEGVYMSNHGMSLSSPYLPFLSVFSWFFTHMKLNLRWFHVI